MSTTTRPVLDLVESDEHRMMRESISGIASKYGPDYYLKLSETGDEPVELWNEFVEKGYVGVQIPTEYGGGGLGLTEAAIVLEETAAAGCPLLFMVLTPGITGSIFQRHGTEEQIDRWLRPVATGQMRMAFAITESDAGSNSQQITTTATAQPDGSFKISGQKTYISGVDASSEVLVVTRTGKDDRARSQISLFVVPSDAPGLTRQEIPTACQMTERQYTLFFDEVEVGEDRLVGGLGNGLKCVFDGLNPERILVGAITCGMARYALKKAVDYAKERAVWGQPIGAHQAISHPLAEGKIMLEQAKLMTQKAAALYDAGLPAGEASNMAKFTGAEAAIHCLDHAIQTHGGNGVALEYQLSGYWFFVRLLRIAPVSREMVLNNIAEHTLGLPEEHVMADPYGINPHKQKALRAWVIGSVVFVVGGITTGVIVADQHGYGAGPWNGKNTVSCYTPGGPYYTDDRPRSEQTCPSNTSSSLLGRAR